MNWFNGRILVMYRKESLQELQECYEELEEKFNEYTQYEQETESKLKQTDRRREILQSMVDSAQNKTTELKQKLSDLADEEELKSREIKQKFEARQQYMQERIAVLSKQEHAAKLKYKLVHKRKKFIESEWESHEQEYLREIALLDQKLLMINAKIEEVKERNQMLDQPKRTSKKHNQYFAGVLPDIPTEEFLHIPNSDPEFVRMLQQRLTRPKIHESQLPRMLKEKCSPSIETLYAELTTFRNVVENKKKQFTNITEECRTLQKLRDSYLENAKNDGN